ncbi:uncharacterized protein LOC134570997 [Pelobates fuscus]|uniref:uncharacterized protein LOC134570997 n=1 Tax=Pelobates fuscus TaxID=191477 RepID=UPI002FE43AA0
MARIDSNNEIRKRLSEYKPGCTRNIQGYWCRRVCLQLYGLSGHGKSSFINTCLCVVEDKEHEMVAFSFETEGPITLTRDDYKLGGLYITDNRGLNKLHPEEYLEMAAQFAHLRCHGDVEWENGLENTFETLRNRIDRCHTEIIVPVFVYSAKYDFTKRRPDEISPFIREACRITGIFPLIVLTHCKKINTDMVCEQFRELGASYIMSIENYTAKNPRRNAETDTKILDFLDVCMKKADQAIDIKQHENNNIEFFNEAMRQVKALVKDKLKEKDAKIQELQKEIKIDEGVYLIIQSERAKLKEEINSLKNHKEK